MLCNMHHHQALDEFDRLSRSILPVRKLIVQVQELRTYENITSVMRTA
jgi:hypothetical protein